MPNVKKGLRHKTLSLAAAEEIRSRILDGTYPPGFQLRQEQLAQELGMSRIPVREALLSLESDGILKILPHKGAIVVELTAEEIEELFNMRALLEPFLLERSAPRLDEEDFKALHKILKSYEEALSHMDSDGLNEINTEFHTRLYRHADSPRILATVRGLLKECDRHTRIYLSNAKDARSRAVNEHAELVRLCENGNFATAVALMREHLERIGLSLVQLLRSRDAA